MNVISYGIRRYGALLVAIGFAVYYGYAAHIHSARLTDACNAFMEVDNVIDRDFPETLPSRGQIDRSRQAIARLCSEHLAGFAYPEDTESAPGR